MTSKGKRIVKDLFFLLLNENDILPPPWQSKVRLCPQGSEGERHKARLIADFIAAMTDASALELHARLFDPQVRL